MQSSSLAPLQTPSCDGGEHSPLIIMAVAWENVNMNDSDSAVVRCAI